MTSRTHSHATDQKRDCQSTLHLRRRMQPPNDGKWYNEHDDVSDDVGQRAPDKESLFVQAEDGLLRGWCPIGREWFASNKINDDANNASTDKHYSKHHRNDLDRSLGEKPAEKKTYRNLGYPD